MKNGAINTIKRPEVAMWVPILTALVAAAVTWGVMTNRISNLEKRFDFFGGRFAETQVKNDARFDSVNGDFTTIQIQLAEIQKDILFIKQALN